MHDPYIFAGILFITRVASTLILEVWAYPERAKNSGAMVNKVLHVNRFAQVVLNIASGIFVKNPTSR
jgi:hypothetical protein